ncbi:hypothetical protein CLOBOL_04763 [Enterocloster bolteae ATCC BAA-613]|uniref:Uncharacterized protein n=1 Tax=Enterocloster bolteae (strain ATCC BAA-613 / DSM 15670 / CCUG 46953 / JCM 12243 / WAL 16351) TaxID=411902 RepID=A8RX13_ENTBW|nr:hypothetical protein CLOBOL_04763 [Enterocloster bolteae ATCC BAA-613]
MSCQRVNRQKEEAAGPVWVRRLFPSLVIYPGMLYIVNTVPEPETA